MECDNEVNYIIAVHILGACKLYYMHFTRHLSSHHMRQHYCAEGLHFSAFRSFCLSTRKNISLHSHTDTVVTLTAVSWHDCRVLMTETLCARGD